MRCAPHARLLAALLSLAQGHAAPAAAAAATLHVGQLTLQRCQTAAPWCGTLPRPLDPSGVVPGTLPIYFEFYPHTAAGAATGTLVATEGGPGYPATDSRDEYLALFAPLHERYDVLIMDNRGTGRSAAVDCHELQTAAQLTEADVGACGRQLGRTAPLYSSNLASDDLAAILKGLHSGPVALYGDSYGTYMAQVFALRHPDQLRALVLDGSYPLSGADYPWYPHYAPAMRDKFNLACARTPACQAIPGSSLDHIASALAQLRAQPFAAQARYGHGEVLRFTANATQLAIVMFGSSPALASLRETDAAARAFAAGDRPPLLRLMAETLASVDSRDATHAPERFSAGLAAAVFCQDPAQIFDMRRPPAQRVGERDRLIAQRKLTAPDSYAPFTIDEYRGMPLDYAFIDECVRWPAVAAPLVKADAHYPDVPVLVLSGELDNMTSVADGVAAATRFPHARHVVIANSMHVNALPHARSECGAVLVRRFVADLTTGDASCAAAVPPVRLLPRFAQRAAQLSAAQAASGNEASLEQLRLVSAALYAGEDVITRAAENGAGEGAGLRGGTFTATAVGEGYRLTLRAVRWTEDVAVSGRIDWAGRDGTVQAHLELRSAQGDGTLELSWRDGSDAPALARGVLGGRQVVAMAPAP
jgi:pimeloyl-ACP methyl ester carboxylesterase